jgi:nicotinamidase-related amidase
MARRASVAPSPLKVGAEPPHLRASRTTLLLIDFINPLRFPGSERLARPALRAAQAAAVLKQQLRRRGLQTVYANDNYGIWRSSFGDVLRECEAEGGTPARMAALLVPQPQDISVLKPRHSAFFATPLQVLLEQLKAERLVLTGLVTDMCVLFTAVDAHVRGYKLWVPRDCVAAETPKRHRDALAYMETVLGIDTRPALAGAKVPRLAAS